MCGLLTLAVYSDAEYAPSQRLLLKTMIPTPQSIARATEILSQIESLQAELAGLFGGSGSTAPKRRGRPPGGGKPAASAPSAGKPVRKMSAAGRARIAAAAKARWAKFRAAKGGKTVDAKPAGKKVKMSAAGRAAIVAAQKARWAKIRAEKKKSARG